MQVSEKFRLLSAFGFVWQVRNSLDLPLSEMGMTI